MSLQATIKNQVIAKFEKYEGRVNWFYLDESGNVTVGIGHLVPDKNAAAGLVLYEMSKGLPTQLADPAKKMDEYDAAKKQKAGLSWKKYTYTLWMKDTDIDTLRNDDIDSFYVNLTNIYRKTKGYPADFDGFPGPVQSALFDMIFNVGPTRLVSVFKNFDSAIKASNWTEAAKQSNRPQVSDERNQYVSDLFLSAAKTVAAAAKKP